MATKKARTAASLEQELELRLAEVRGQLSPNDERIAEFVRSHLGDLAFHTAESLAQGAGVSAAAVVRFSRRLDFASFRDLRDRARIELQSEHAPESLDRNSTLTRKTQRDISNLELLPRLLGESLQEAARVLSTAHQLWFLANRETYGLVVYAYRLLHQTRKQVSLVDPSYPDPVRDLSEDDAVVACTFRPYARATLDLVQAARDKSAHIVILTDGLGHEFIDPADTVLAVPVDSPTLFLSFTPALCVLETLAAEVAMSDVDETYDTLDSTARFVDRSQMMLESFARHPPRRLD